jgi:putative ABC transport system permease protein
MNRRKRMMADLEQDIRDHIEKETQDNIERGMSPEEARYAALRKFGNVTRVKEDTREVWSFGWLEQLWEDVRYALRMLRKNPGFTAVAVMTLALGIGSNTAIFSIVHAVVLRPLPYYKPNRIMRLWMAAPEKAVRQLVFSGPNFVDVRDQSRTFLALAAHRGWPFIVTGGSQPLRVYGQRVSASLFDVLSVAPLMGRAFAPGEDVEGKDSVVIVSYRFWQGYLRGAANIIGRSVVLSDSPRTVIGVMPADFEFPSPETDLWVPLALTPQDRNRNLETFYVVGRLRDDVSRQQAQSEMTGIAGRLADQFPGSNKGKTIRVVPLHDDLIRDVRPSLLVLFGAVAFVLLITCANLGNLLLTRIKRRVKEFAVRSALGASRQRLVRQVVTEGLVLATAGGVCGVWLGHLCRRLLVQMASGQVPRVEESGLHPVVLGFALAITTICGLLFGLYPAFYATRVDLAGAMKQGFPTFARRLGPRGLLVVVQVSVAVVLLTGDLLMLRTLLKLNEVNLGFNTNELLAFETFLSPKRYKTPESLTGFYQHVLERVRSIPGVRAVGATNGVPLTDVGLFLSFEIAGHQKPGEQLVSSYRAISSGYLSAMGIPLLRGRNFTERDSSTSPGVSLINEAFAQRFFPDHDPIGQFIDIGDGYNKPREIVGVIGDTKGSSLTGDVAPEVYVVYVQRPWQWTSYVVNSQVNVASLVPAIREAVWSVDRDVPINDMRTMDELLSRQIAQPRLLSVLVSVFAGLAVLLAGLGIFSVLSNSVTERTQEMAIRVALGAQRQELLKLVVGYGLVLTFAGIGAGLVAAFGLTSFVSSLLYGVRPTDPATFVGVSIILILAALFASYIPARRVTKVDPMVALRYG